MSAGLRGVGSETGGVMLIILGVGGYLLDAWNVARLLTLFVIYFGALDVVAPADGRSRNVLVLAVGIWLALTAYGIFGLDFLNSWPLLVVLIGLAMVVQSLLYRTTVPSSTLKGQ